MTNIVERGTNVLKIVIYNPIREEAVLISNIIKNTLVKAKSSFELSTYMASGNIIKNLNENPYYYDIFILNSDDNNSSIISEILRKHNLQASVIFTSNNLIQIDELLKFRPTGIITETKNQQKIFSSFKNAYKEQNIIDSFFTIKTREKVVKINYRDIDYFENNQRIVTLHNNLKKEKIDFYAKFDDIYCILPKDKFIKCHQSFIVNMSHVKILDKINKKFILLSGQEIEISKRNLAETVNMLEVFSCMIN